MLPEHQSSTRLPRSSASSIRSRSTEQELTELVNNFDVEKRHSHADTVQATFLRDDLTRHYNMFDQVDRKLRIAGVHQRQSRNQHRRDNDQPRLPKVPNSNKRLKYVVILPVGILVALTGLFLLLEVRSERVGDPDLLSSRVQSEVVRTTAIADDPVSPQAERADGRRPDRTVHPAASITCGSRSAATINATDLGRCVLVTSAVGGEGKTTLAAQLAARCGNAGISTLLIDADLRRAALCPLLDVPEGPGLSDVLEGAKIEDVVIPVQGGTFDLLCAGTPVQDTSRLFQGRNFAMLIAQLRQRYQLIFIDSPPVLPVPDALILGRWADGALLAARFEISRSPQVERARRQLDNAGIPVLGTVINGMRSSDAYYGRYSYGRQRTSQANPSSTI